MFQLWMRLLNIKSIKFRHCRLMAVSYCIYFQGSLNDDHNFVSKERNLIPYEAELAPVTLRQNITASLSGPHPQSNSLTRAYLFYWVMFPTSDTLTSGK